MLRFKGHVAVEPRGYQSLGTGPLDRFYKADDRWFFLSVSSGGDGASQLNGVEGLEAIDPSADGLEQRLEAVFVGQPAAVWVERLRKAGISAQEHVPVKELMTDAYVKARGLSVEQEVEGVGTTTAPGLSVRLSRTPMRLGETPRRPGSDAPQILEEIGMADQLSRLEKAWVLQLNDLPPAWAGGG
jgi:hypothetical protein